MAAPSDPDRPAPPRGRARLAAGDRRALLEEAALACLARGGIRAFTVDRIIAEAGVSRGLITHHFGSMEGLLAAVYARVYGDWIAALTAPRPGLSRLDALIEALVSPALYDRDTLAVWLALWGEIAANPALGAEHRASLGRYRAIVLAALAEDRPDMPAADLETLATAFICLIDGIAVQRCADPDRFPPDAARAACRAFLSGGRSTSA